jgi:hypothetical protein
MKAISLSNPHLCLLNSYYKFNLIGHFKFYDFFLNTSLMIHDIYFHHLYVLNFNELILISYLIKFFTFLKSLNFVKLAILIEHITL